MVAEPLIWLAGGLFVVAILWAVLVEAQRSRERR